MKHVNVTQWVRGRKPSSPTRPKASHQVGSRTEGRPPRGGVRSRGKARTQAASLNSEKCIMVDKGQVRATGPKADDMQCIGRQQSCPRQGKRAGHHRGLRAGHVDKGVIRELGRASRLLGNNRRSKGDRRQSTPWRLLADAASRRANPGASREGHEPERVNPRYRKGAKSGPTGTDEGSRSNAQYRGAGDSPCPDAWGTEAQGTHDNSRRSAGRQCRA